MDDQEKEQRMQNVNRECNSIVSQIVQDTSIRNVLLGVLSAKRVVFLYDRAGSSSSSLHQHLILPEKYRYHLYLYRRLQCRAF